jgi:hypothetical protein
MATLTPEAQQIFGATYAPPHDLWLRVHFTESEASQAAGREFLKRFARRTKNRDPEVNEKVAPAQITAIGKWGVQRAGSFDYLSNIAQPTLVVNGEQRCDRLHDHLYILQQNFPNAQLMSSSGRQSRFAVPVPERSVRHVSMFLAEQRRHPFQSTVIR